MVYGKYLFYLKEYHPLRTRFKPTPLSCASHFARILMQESAFDSNWRNHQFVSIVPTKFVHIKIKINASSQYDAYYKVNCTISIRKHSKLVQKWFKLIILITCLEFCLGLPIFSYNMRIASPLVCRLPFMGWVI